MRYMYRLSIADVKVHFESEQKFREYNKGSLIL